MTLTKIRLELARTKEYPSGDPNHGYEFVAPLDDAGHLDLASWSENQQLCSVRRFSPDAGDEHGLLIHTAKKHWAFSYEPGDADDEPLFRLEQHRFRLGEYVSVREHDGVSRPFRVVAIAPWKIHAAGLKKSVA